MKRVTAPWPSQRKEEPVAGKAVMTEQPLAVLAGPQTHGAVLRLAREHFCKGASVLDCPAGSGALTRDLLKAGFSVTPADLFPENFSLSELECLFCDMGKRFPMTDESFDAIISVEGIEHLEDQYTFIRECHRVLRPGGYLLITTPNILNLSSRMKFFLTGFWSLCGLVSEFKRDPTHDHIAPIAYPWLRYILHTNGFRVRRVATDKWRKSAKYLLPLRPLLSMLTRSEANWNADVSQQERNEEMLSQLLSRDVLLGRTLIVLADKL